jgi:hypothetical protein
MDYARRIFIPSACLAACLAGHAESGERPRPRRFPTVQSRTVLAGEAGFRLECPAVWPVPAQGARQPVAITLHVTNRSARTARFYLFDTLRILLRTPGGASLPGGGGRDATQRGVTNTPPLKPGQSFAVVRQAHLYWNNEGHLRLEGSDGFGGIWYFDDLQAGAYQLLATYRSDAKALDGGAAYWSGDITVGPVTIRVK